MIDFSKYIDNQGLIVHMKDGKPDGGDAFHRMGLLGFLTAAQNIDNIMALEHIRNGYRKALVKLHIEGRPVRHPIQYPDPKDMSRDQLVPAYAAMDLLKMPEIKQLPKCFAPNRTDIIGPDVRYMDGRSDRTLLMPADLCTYWNTLTRTNKLPRWKHETKRFIYRDMDDVGDCINLAIIMIHGMITQPTPLLHYAINYYLQNAPLSYGSFLDLRLPVAEQEKAAFRKLKILERNPFQASWNWYFRPSEGAPPFHELARPLITRYLSNQQLLKETSR